MLPSIGQGFLGGMLLLAATGKMLAGDDFRRYLRAFGLPARLSRAFAIAFPPLEATLGLGVITGSLPSITLIAVGAVTFLFVVIQVVPHFQAQQPTCRCFGPLDRLLPSHSGLLRALIMFAVAISLVLSRLFGHSAVHPSVFSAVTVRDGLSAAAAFTLVFALVTEMRAFARGVSTMLPEVRTLRAAAAQLEHDTPESR